MTDEEFKEVSIKEVLEAIHKNNYPCTINRVSNVQRVGCEWCDNSTREIRISVTPNKGAPMFTNGHANAGLYTIHEDKRWHPQSEWHVCGQCPES